MKTRNFLTSLLLVFLAACTALQSPPPEPALEAVYAPRTLYVLGGLETLRARFNADAGTTRLILLMSPT